MYRGKDKRGYCERRGEREMMFCCEGLVTIVIERRKKCL